MSVSLRDQLIGAWRLVRYVERPVDGSPPREPMTTKPKGLILYTHDGFMSAQLSAPDRKPFSSGDWFVATPEEFEAEASSYIAYSGAWEVQADEATIIHEMEISLFPNWCGQRQPRKIRIDGDLLHLSSLTPGRSGGQVITAELVWQRASTTLHPRTRQG